MSEPTDGQPHRPSTDPSTDRGPGHRPVVLCILDGWGVREGGADNAPALAATPTFDSLRATRHYTTLEASGEDVGLPPGQIGNSEVGHTNIGAGRVVWMDLPRIDRAIDDGSFAANPALGRFAETLRGTGGTAHVIGLASPGGVHAHQRHMVETARALSAAGVPVALHLLTDGRDVGPRTARDQVATLLSDLEGVDGVEIASVIGRFYAMDRDKRWDRVRLAAATIANRASAAGAPAASAMDAIDAAYDRGESDEFILPTAIDGPTGPIGAADGVLCMNFRTDRVREILGALVDPDFEGERDAFTRPAAALGIVRYSETLDRYMDRMFEDQDIPDTLGEVVAAAGLTQLRLAETEKYPHVTFFLNGGREAPAPGERRHMAPSPKVRTYDEAPEMAAAEVTEVLVEAIRAGTDLIVCNYANPDMVGHTGSLDAAMRACAAVDRGLGAAVAALEEVGGAMLVIADHGNCEQMVDPVTGGAHTAHTLNPVPAILIETGPAAAGHGLHTGRLADVAPTLLALLGLGQPAAMTGRSLLTPAAESGLTPETAEATVG
ncbi:MAG: 2,3-bisphosphoglycerate-independent phosphoglycerate mutase [Pseudomonadota bacterium]